MTSTIRALFQGLRQYIRALALVRFALWTDGPHFGTYEEAVEFFKSMPLEERKAFRIRTRSPILMWWPGKGWIDTPYNEEIAEESP
jgi:hypothetical protein